MSDQRERVLDPTITVRDDTAPSGAPAPPTDAGSSPLWAVLAITWLTSFGTAVGWAGVFFVTEHEFGFDKTRNLQLAALLGAAYALTAFFARPLCAAVARAPGILRRGRRLSSRAVLGVLLALSGAASLPALSGAEWGIWVFGLAYVPLTGLIWPAVEAYVSGGRRGRDLGKAAGLFNLAWALALVCAMWSMAGLIEDHAVWIIAGLAPLHLLTLCLLPVLRPEPAGHGSAASPHSPEELRRLRALRRVFRASLFLSYVLHSALTPMLPQIMAALDITTAARPALASVWMGARFCVFLLMTLWHGWHARFLAAPIAMTLMIGGFALSLAAPGVGALVVGLAVLGAGIGAVYSCAIYYALEVGSTDVDAGGKHEAMIGFGYTIGPLGALAGLSLLAG